MPVPREPALGEKSISIKVIILLMGKYRPKGLLLAGWKSRKAKDLKLPGRCERVHPNHDKPSLFFPLRLNQKGEGGC